MTQGSLREAESAGHTRTTLRWWGIVNTRTLSEIVERMNGMKNIKKLIFSTFIILFSIAIPVLVVSLFYQIFPEFYSKGFFTGITHIYFVCPLMMIINCIISILYLSEHFKNKPTDTNKSPNGRRYFTRIVISILVQIGLNILTENPFRDPPISGF